MQALSLIFPIFFLPLSNPSACLWILFSRAWNSACFLTILLTVLLAIFIWLNHKMVPNYEADSCPWGQWLNEKEKLLQWGSALNPGLRCTEVHDHTIAIQQELPSSHRRLHPSSAFPSHSVCNILIFIKGQPLLAALSPQAMTPINTLFLSSVWSVSLSQGCGHQNANSVFHLKCTSRMLPIYFF